MTAPQTAATTDHQSIIAALQQRLDAGLAREAILAEELAARDAALDQRNSEYSERIEHQTATVDVLKAMSASPGDPQPVFDLIARRARDICGGYGMGVYEFDGSLIHLRAWTGVSDDPKVRDAYVALFPRAPTRELSSGRAILDRQIIRIDDPQSEPGMIGAMIGVTGSNVSVPMMRGDAVIGVVQMGSRERGGFSDTQIELLKTFAEQAVIAITSAETYRALQTRTSDLQETLEYQTATSDVLKVISRSTFDLQPVLDTVVETAARLCDADTGTIAIREGEVYRYVVSTYSATEPEYWAISRQRTIVPGRETVAGRVALEGKVVHVDILADPDFAWPEVVASGRRTTLGVPLLREGAVLGTVVLARKRAQPFTERQIELVRTFADQAVIAIENTRLITEQREALEQQTATAEVLQVINASPGNLAPVFDAVLERGLRLCGAAFGMLGTYDGTRFRWEARLGGADRRRGVVVTPEPGSALERVANGQRVVHIPDLVDTDAYRNGIPSRVGLVERSGARAGLWVALRKDDTVLGVILIYRREPRAFSGKQIALLESFAAQAVIAMENARLINEQREALEQQTATAEVLQVINASPGDLTPVFEAMLEKAMRLCGATIGAIYRYNGQWFDAVALRGVTPGFAAFSAENPMPTIPGGPPSVVLETKRPVQVVDIAATDRYRDGTSAYGRALLDIGGIRAVLNVPLLKDGAVLGLITIYRAEPGAFSDKQIALLENFAAQAVIAMENARLLTETREALDQQTATAEVLQVINSSPGNLTPVFDAMLEKAMRLCGAAFGMLYTYDEGLFHTVAHRGVPAALAEYRVRHPPSARPGGSAAPLVETRRPVHVLDMMEQGFYRDGDATNRATVDLGGARTTLTVPLLKDEALLGAITIYRQEVRGFSDKQIALLENFAAQAVIAMENARLLNELRARTDELAQRQAELRVTFENMGDGVAMFDADLRLAAWNRNFQRIIDLPDTLLAERASYADYLRMLTDRGEFGATGIEAELSRRVEDTEQELRLERVRPDGRVIEVRRNAVPGGGFVLIYSDITERKRSEEEIRAARDAAETALRELRTAQANLIQAEKMASLGQLTAGIAHEIKNPLNFVNNFAALSVDLLSELKETAAPGFAALSDKQRAEVEEVSVMLTSNLEKITEHGKRADGIVKAMLEHSRGSSGERRMVDLSALIDEALNLAYHGARAQDQSFNIALERDFGEGIAPIDVNPQDITRVFLNIFSNGFYATTRRARDGRDAGFEPTLKVTTRDAGEAVEIRVRDNGIGIPVDIRDKLFQPFFTTKPTGEGTGLGLSITYDIVTQQHGGSIAVDSKVGEYSEFTIQLPRNP